MTNRIKHAVAARLSAAFSRGAGVREAARNAGVHRDTAMRFRRDASRGLFKPLPHCETARIIELHATIAARQQTEIDRDLQRAYDLLWDGDCEGCDAITATLPEDQAKAMLDDWLDDQCAGPNWKPSRWYEPKEDTTP